MTENQLQFRVGLLVIAAFAATVTLIFRFGEMRWFLEPAYSLTIHFTEAPGVQPGTPVRKNGVGIGTVRKVLFDEEKGGVTVIIDVKERFPLRSDSRPLLVRTILGDASLEFSPGTSRKAYVPGAKIEGIAAEDPLKMVARLEGTLTETLNSFAKTSNEWGLVAKSVNDLIDTRRGNLDLVVEQAAESLHQFTLVMRSTNKLLSDPKTEEALRVTLEAMPKIVMDTRRTILAINSAIVKVDQNLSNLQQMTKPLAERSETIAVKLEGSITNLEVLLAELSQFSKAINDNDGTLRLLATDPQLYRNMNESAATLQTLLKNLDPTIKDLRIFADKVARHPELIGVGGAFRGSSGVK